ncbi:outer membrane protein assembly factor BamB family protein [Halosimplex halophilum]|uniref:outer membrane protein assembly factor BamB family protein n=1 Tax=Halosimplex halophilum TaxID=2559572 RepID=UPI0014355F61|nr:PQQ-binding-like beta-propeller repeat protein [Halosimplex halophilum]
MNGQGFGEPPAGGVSGDDAGRVGATGSSWPQPHYDARNSAYTPNTVVPDTEPGRLWTFGVDAELETEPVVAGGSAFVVPRDDVLYAVSLREGTERWRFDPDAPIFTAPAVADGTVYVAPNNGQVRALAVEDGTERWAVNPGRSVNPQVTVADGTVYVVTYYGNVYALSASDGEQQWTASLDERVATRPPVGDGALYVSTQSGNVHALATADGSERWRFETDSEYMFTEPTVGDGTVYVPVGRVDGGSYYYALSTDDGSERWRLERSSGSLDMSPAVTDDTVYLQDVKGITARSPADGSERWTGSVEGEATAVAVTESAVVVGGAGDVVTAFARSDGSVRWRREVGGTTAPVAVAGGVVYVASGNRGLVALGDELPPTPSPTPSPTPTRSPTPTPTATPTATPSPTPTEAPTPTESVSATPGDVPYALREGVKTVVDTGYGTYYLIRSIPEVDPERVAVTTTDYGLVGRTTTKDVVALDTFSEGLWAADWGREVERMRTVREASAAYETLGRLNEIGWDLAEIVVFLASPYKKAAVAPALEIATDAISWTMDEVQRPYRAAFQRLTACLNNARSIDQHARNVVSHGGLGEAIETWVGAAQLMHGAYDTGSDLATAWSQLSTALQSGGGYSASASTALSTAKGFFVGFFVGAASGMIEGDVEKKTAVHGLQNAYANMRLPVVETLRDLQGRFDSGDRTVGDIYRYNAYLLSAYQMDALLFAASELYWEAISDGWLGGVWDAWSGAQRRADEYATRAETAKRTARTTQRLFGLAQTRIGEDVTGSINAEFRAGGGS